MLVVLFFFGGGGNFLFACLFLNFFWYYLLNKSGSLVFSVCTIANKILTWRNALFKIPLCRYENKKK